MVQIPIAKNKKPQVLGVTGINFDSDEEETKGRYNKKRKNSSSEDEDIERDESLTLDELDGWMTKINQRRLDEDKRLGADAKAD